MLGSFIYYHFVALLTQPKRFTPFPPRASAEAALEIVRATLESVERRT
jgi:hypothetical protein